MEKYKVTVCIKINEHQSEMKTFYLMLSNPYDTFWDINNYPMRSFGSTLIRSDSIVYVKWEKEDK